MIVSGILAAFVVNAILASSGNWRLMLGLAAVPSLILLVGMFFMPGDAALLVDSGGEEPAHDVLEDLPGDENPRERIQEIHEVEDHEDGETGLRGLLKAKWVRPALIVACGLAIFQQFVGIDTIIYYAPTTLTQVGFGKTAAIYANLIIGVVNVGMTVIAIKLIDRAGRKPLLIAVSPAWSPACSCSASRSRCWRRRTIRAIRRRSSRSSAWARSSPRSRRRGARWSG